MARSLIACGSVGGCARWWAGLLVFVGAAGCGRIPSRVEAPASKSGLTAKPALAPALDPQTAQALAALGYVTDLPTRNPSVRGVTRHDRAAAQDGLNLYAERASARAVLVDMDGEVVHEWVDATAGAEPWMHVEPLEDGDILVLTKGDSIARYSWDSTLRWRTELDVHHDLAVDADGQIYALVRWREAFEGTSIRTDGLVVLDGDGHPLGDPRPLLPRFEAEVREALSARTLRTSEPGSSEADRPFIDVLHTNSVEMLRAPIVGIAPAGSLLISMRSLNTVAIMDPRLETVLWAWGTDELDHQHDATQTSDATIVVFDNGRHRGASRILEVDPVRDSFVEHRAPVPIFTPLRGGVQRLANGNWLVTEADRGHALEWSERVGIVWEFWNPQVHGEGGEATRGVICRLNRFPRSRFAGAIEEG